MRKTEPLQRAPVVIATDEQCWRADQRMNWTRQLWPQWMLVIVSLGAVAVAGFTLSILHGTLAATQNAASAAKAQAIAAATQAQTALLSAQTAQKQLDMSERAWVSVEVSLFDRIKPHPDGGIGVPLQYNLTNHGNSVAENVEIETDVYPMQLRPDGFVEQEKVCKQNAGFPVGPLFPGPGRVQQIWHEIGHEQIDQMRQWYENSLKDHPMEIRPPFRIFFSLGLVGCIDYSYPVTDATHHKTGYIYEIVGHGGIDPTVPTVGALISSMAGQAFFAN